ncbi:extracellular solute-binding protein [Paenibacillus sp. GD4]|uniref:extracellular solute-binding protein n=1 Tax=Paenibacillus sp. GD4 TaxID=3068890 RepID=UPI002796CBCE|nr:extracellular solute-binding protein [Paenibacillus sp. GD4]MDQ1914917.1 extracellular solute-binding protein [Paenibacillus sp. GD4]
MSWKRKTKTLLIVGAASAVAISGCSTKAEETKGNEGASTKPPTFKVMFDYNVDTKGMSLTDNEYINYLQEKTGVRVELESPGSAGYLDKLNILMASGEYPDAFMVNDKDKNKLLQFAADGLLTDIAPYLDKYPNLKNVMPKEAWLPVSDGGKIWGIPYNRHDGFNQVVYINKEWLETLKLDIPRTIDDFYKVMKAFTEQDPDRNGKNDTFGLIALNDMLYGGKMFQAAFDAETWKFRGGELLPPELTDEYKEYLKFMNKLIEEKILDPEWPTTVGTIFRQKVATGKYGMFNNFWHFASGAQLAPGTAERYIAIEPPIRADGKPTMFTYNTTNRHYIAIPKDTKQADQLLKFLDWSLSPEGTRFNFLGIEGKHYTNNNGKFEKTKEERAGLHWAFALVKHGLLNDEVKSLMQADYADHVVQNLSLAQKFGQLDKIAASLPYYPELVPYNLPKITQEYTAKTILGNEKVDASWNDYVKKYRASGGDKAIKLWTEWYNKEGVNLK